MKVLGFTTNYRIDGEEIFDEKKNPLKMKMEIRNRRISQIKCGDI
jgi:hypothetical protein